MLDALPPSTAPLTPSNVPAPGAAPTSASAIPLSASLAAHISTLDALRGFAALIVLAMHAREIFWVGMRNYAVTEGFDASPGAFLAYISAPLMYGAFGVSILFALSGYVIHKSVAATIDRPDFTFDSRGFLSRRFVRVFPTLVLALIVTGLCDYVSRQLGSMPSSYDVSLSALAANLMFLQGIVAWPFGSNTPLWSLAIEMQFYLFYPLALMLRRRIGMDAMAATAVALSLAGALLIHSFGLTAFPQFFVAWWIGAYVAEWHVSGRPMPYRWRLCSIAILAIGCIAYSAKLASLGVVLWAIGFAPWLGWIVASEFALPRRLQALLAWIGTFSYTLYAVHFPVLILLSGLWLNGERSSNINWAILASLVSLAVGYACYWLAEQRSIEVLKTMRAQSRATLLPVQPLIVRAGSLPNGMAVEATPRSRNRRPVKRVAKSAAKQELARQPRKTHAD